MGIHPEYRQAALSAATRFVRQHPELPAKLYSADTAWQAVVKQFLSDAQVSAYLKRVIDRNPEAEQELLDDAAERITETEPQLIRALYRRNRASGAYDLLNGSERLVLLAIYVQALRTDRYGGRQVAMSREYMAKLIEVQFGRRLTETAIKNARRKLTQLGYVIVAKPGKGWAPGDSVGTRSTQFRLPIYHTDGPTVVEGEESLGLTSPALPAENGLGKLGVRGRRRGWAELPEDIPPMTEQTRNALENFRIERREAKRRHELTATPSRLPAARRWSAPDTPTAPDTEPIAIPAVSENSETEWVADLLDPVVPHDLTVADGRTTDSATGTGARQDGVDTVSWPVLYVSLFTVDDKDELLELCRNPVFGHAARRRLARLLSHSR